MRFRCGEKLACTRDGLRKRRGMLLELHAPWNWGLQVTFSCFVDAVLLCVCMCWDTALELVHQSDVFYSSVLQFYCVVRFSLCRSQWNGCVKVPRCCGCVRGILFLFLQLKVINCSLMAAWKLRMVFWQQIFSSFWHWWFSFPNFLEKVLQNRRFSAWASRSGFGAAVCVALVRTSIVFCNAVSADRSGMAAWKFLAAAPACGIPLFLAAESRKSYCSGCMKVANGALAADFSSFLHWWFSFSNSLEKVLQNRRFSAFGRRGLVLELQFV